MTPTDRLTTPTTDLGRRLLASHSLIGTWTKEALADMVVGIEDASRTLDPQPADALDDPDGEMAQRHAICGEMPYHEWGEMCPLYRWIAALLETGR